MAQIKGFAIRGLLRYLKQADPTKTADLIASLPASIRSNFDRQIVASNMYPYEAFSHLLRGIDGKLGNGDLRRCQDVGDFAARQDINGMFKMMMSVMSPRTVVERSGLFWSKYCDTGRFLPMASDSKHSSMRLEDFPGMDEAHCHLMLGWIKRWALMTNAKSVEVQHSACVNHGGKYCQWDGHWS